MTINISNSSGKPIYEQIVLQIKNQISAGVLSEGDPLPSIRLLAKELRISVITTKRAYEELERDGFIETVAGKGSFVARQNLELLREHALTRIEERLGEAVELARQHSIGCEELVEMLELLFEEG
ncbi:MAG: GntR family transcriptional regulator [Oscillospiraceae bacterium]|nr:MAG: GntR family transcriptional regulator [Oscillospiraceae bacterium]